MATPGPSLARVRPLIPPKDPLHREFGTHDRGPKRTLSGVHGSWRPRPGLRLMRFRITPWLMATLVLCLASARVSL